MGEGREVSRGSDRTLRRDHGVDVRVQEGDERLERGAPDARVPFREAVRPEKHQRADGLLGNRLADAGRVTPDEVALQLGELPVRDDDVGELPEAGRHAVDDAVLRQRRGR